MSVKNSNYKTLLGYTYALPDPLKGVVIDWLEGLPCDLTNCAQWNAKHLNFFLPMRLTIVDISDLKYEHLFTYEEVLRWTEKQESV